MYGLEKIFAASVLLKDNLNLLIDARHKYKSGDEAEKLKTFEDLFEINTGPQPM